MMLRKLLLSWKSNIVPLEYTYYVLLHLNLSLLLKAMNSRSNVSRILKEKIANEGAPPRGDQVPPLEGGENNDQAPLNLPPLMDENIRASHFQIDQEITTQEQASTAQTQAMMT